MKSIKAKNNTGLVNWLFQSKDLSPNFISGIERI